jgi:Family of unknown function (DUF5999)
MSTILREACCALVWMTRPRAYRVAGSGIRGSAVTTRPGIACDRLCMRQERACQHQPRCPGARARDRAAACVVACHPEQGWSLLCNGVVLFDDAEALVLDAPAVLPGRAPVVARAA